uniref:Autophagy-related protein n=1 Tax=viral metagenome TaxID=1070528 RepID=A0A6C0ESJ8_9ZZZZ
MQAVTITARRFFEDGKTYLTQHTRFKDKHTFEKRLLESSRIMEKYPNRIPIICEYVGRGVLDIDRKKYLVPLDLSMAGFLYVIRQRIKIKPEQSIYLFVGDSVMVTGNQTLGTVYEKYKDLDGFLYTCYSGENTFG